MGTRCFIAVELDKIDIRMRFQQVQRRLEATGANIKSVEPENIHITMKFLGNIPDNVVPQVGRLVEELEVHPFHLEIRGVGVFPHLGYIKVIWAGVEGDTDVLLDVQERLDEELTVLGFKPERQKFHPHATLCRVRGGRNKELLVEELQELENTAFGEIDIDQIALKKSKLTPQGPIYTTLATTERRSKNTEFTR
ncbi:MAG: RNA 2',3'-cyclic phosphodiesterase [Candidatus Bathyarchaeia archaeon]